MGSPFPGPQALYQNPPIEPQFYQPSRFDISNITLGKTTLVTTLPTTINGISVTMNYVVGQLVRLLIPPQNGCYQLNQKTGYVLSLPTSIQVELSIDSSVNVSSFTSTILPTQPQIVAIGDVNQGQNNSNGIGNQLTYVLGSFINISPN